MTKDDWIYAFLLFISLLVGQLLHYGSSKYKQYLSSIVGLTMAYIVCGAWIWHSLLTILIGIIIISKINFRYIHIFTFIWCFGYLAFFRTTVFWGLTKVPAHSNAIQLLITLRLISLAFDLRDTCLTKATLKKSSPSGDDTKLKLQIKYQGIEPSFLDMFHYSYCFIGLLTGPFYRYRTYQDMLNSRPLNDFTLKSLFYYLKEAPIYGILYLIVSHFYSVDYCKSEDFLRQPFWYRLLMMVIIFFSFRMRMYFAWRMAEGVCMSANLGAYPVPVASKCGMGPSNLDALEQLENLQQKGDSANDVRVEYDFKTIENLNIQACEWDITVREGMKGWNTSVQFWLAFYIYRRVPIKSVRTFVTMTVSAFWHGVHPGYYLSFLTIPPMLMAEEAMVKVLNKPWQNGIYRWLAWFFKMRSLEYMAMGFLLLEFQATINYWSSIYFCVHCAILFWIVLGGVKSYIASR